MKKFTSFGLVLFVLSSIFMAQSAFADEEVKVTPVVQIVSQSINPTSVDQNFIVVVTITRPEGNTNPIVVGTVSVSDGGNGGCDGGGIKAVSGSSTTFTYSCDMYSTSSGEKTLTATYTPLSPSSLYFNSSSGTTTHIVKSTPHLSLTNSTVIFNGAPQSAIVSVVGSIDGIVNHIKYDGSPDAPTNPGEYTITADFTPTDTASYDSLLATFVNYFTIAEAPSNEDTPPTPPEGSRGSGGGQLSSPSPVLGCMNSAATNYNSSATQDNGSCILPPPPVTGQVLGASTGPIDGCGDRTDGFSITTGQSCVGNSGNGGKVLGASKFIFTLWLQLGKKNDENETTELEKRLTTEGFYKGAIDGKFGKLLEDAVKAYQKANSPIRIDGIVGPETRGVLNK